jgi:Mg-chelatase subunit ChlD
MPPKASRRATWLLLLAVFAGCRSQGDDQSLAVSEGAEEGADGASDHETTSTAPTASGEFADDSTVSAAAPGSGVTGARPATLPSAGFPAGMAGASATASGAGSAAGDAVATAGAAIPVGVAVPATVSPPTTVLPPQGGTLTAGSWDDNRNYAHFAAYRAGVDPQTTPGILPFDTAEFEAAHAEAAQGLASRATLDVAFVVDTTGSMGDEIAYLQREFLDLSQAIEAAYPKAAQRWALVVYRDKGDVYLTETLDFTDDPQAFRTKLATYSAGGGGDTPEAPDAAFGALNQLAWRSDATSARLAFWVADAPHHESNAARFADAVRATRALGVHVYPVASSGVDELTELSMRSIAQLTQGRYLFLTDDSGVGNAHKQPTIPCYHVTRLDQAILRMVDLELSGVYTPAAKADILRSVGDPIDGVCQLASGKTAQAF